ncbi:MAG: cation diffusion facilitator family transporter [Bacteroidales bacterium]|nr:cation diffusion facilitator family transporter [Bacteroidales bacterium]
MTSVNLEEREHKITKVTLIGSVVNLFLTIGKLLAGIIGHSAAMISDGVHSLSDFVSDIVVLVFVKISSKGTDKSHDFGHGKFETFATLIIGLLLIAIGGKLLANGIIGINCCIVGDKIETPGLIALWAALISIVSKEILYQYTAHTGKKVDSPVMLANAWHHRSDALSSVGSFLGIGGAIVLGEKGAFLDPLAGCIISIFLIVAAVRISMPALKELLDVSLPEEMENEIITIAESVPGVIDLHELKTHKNGPSIIIEAHITVDSTISIVDAHNISTEVENAIVHRFGHETQISIHVEPLEN